MREISAEDIVADIRRRANLENSDFCTDQEILEYFNQEVTELRGKLRLNEGQVHESSSEDISVTNGTTSYPLPLDFWQLLSVNVTIGGRVRALEPFMETERADLINGPVFTTLSSPLYRIMGRTIDFLPANQDYTATLRYVPSNGRLRLGLIPADMFDGYNGFEMAPIYGTVALCLAKEQLDPSFWEGRKMALYKQIDALAAQRDAGRPERVTDVTGGLDNGFGPFGW